MDEKVPFKLQLNTKTETKIEKMVPITKEMKERKLLVYMGNIAEHPAPFDFQGVKFEKQKVTPVTNDVYEYFRHVRTFKEIHGNVMEHNGKLWLDMGSAVLDWPIK